MRKFISAMLLAATAATPLMAQPQVDRNDRREQRQDGRQDRGEVRQDRAEVRQDRAEVRGDVARGDYGEARRDRRELRQDRAELRSDRRDLRGDRRDDYRGGRGYDGGFNNGGGYNRGAWNNGWRQDRRYDWQSYRNGNRQAYRLPRYYGPGGSYRRVGVGYRIGAPFYSQRYWISDPYAYRLPPAYGPYRWVRYYDDVLLIDIASGFVRDSIYGFFG